MKKWIAKGFLLSVMAIPLFNCVSAQDITVKLTNTKFIGNSNVMYITPTNTYDVEETTYMAKGVKHKLAIENGALSIYKYENGAYVLLEDALTTVTLNKPTNEDYLTISAGSHTYDYKGNMEFKIEGAYIRPYNTVEFETYLKGVVPYEMSNGWGGSNGGLEALKAQAVTARTYAIRQGVLNGSVIDDTTSYQVYGGFDENFTQSNLAVDSTKNQISTFNGSPTGTFYSATSGGTIMSVTNSWGTSLASYPYLVRKEDPFSKDAGVHLNWSFSLNKTQINLAGRDLTKPDLWWNSVSEVNSTIIPTLKQKMGLASDVKITQIKTLSFMTSNLQANQVLNGTITVEYIDKDVMENGSIKIMEKTITNRHDNLRAYFGTNASGYQNLRSPNVTSVLLNNGVYTVTGSGFGHGIGMSQWGAYEMAKEGYTYKQILGFYYPGTSLKHDNGTEEKLPNVTPGVDQESSETADNVYIVQSGDWLSKIANQFNTTVTELKRLNNLTSDLIHPGQKLFIREKANPSPPPTEPIVPEVEIHTVYASIGGARAYITTNKGIYYKTYPSAYKLKMIVYNREWFYSNILDGNGQLTRAYFHKDEVQSSQPVITQTVYASIGGAKAYKTTSKTGGYHKVYPKGYKLKVIVYNQDWFYSNVLDAKGKLVRAYFHKDQVQSSQPTVNKTVSTNATKYYTVKSGDTLSKIARTYNVSLTNIKIWNGLKSDVIHVGQRLIVSK